MIGKFVLRNREKTGVLGVDFAGGFEVGWILEAGFEVVVSFGEDYVFAVDNPVLDFHHLLLASQTTQLFF